MSMTSTVSLFSASRVKRFLHKFRLGPFRNGIVNSPFVTITNRQFSFTISSVSLRRRRNPRLELIEGLNDFGVGRPVKDARLSSSQALLLTPWDILQFLDTCDPEQLSLSSLTFLNEALFDSLKIYKFSSAETKCVLESVGMQKLCQAVEKQCLDLFPKDLINICKLFVYLNAPGNHPTFQMVLRRLSKHANSYSFSLFDILFLSFLLNQMRKEHTSPTSEAIARSLPKIFERQLSTKLEDTNLGELTDCLQYAVRNNYSESELKKIVQSIREKQTQLNYNEAHSRSKSRPRLPGSPEFLEASSSKILATNCRHCAAKKETLGHVLGGCQKGNELRVTRHHEIRSIIAKALREAPSFGQRLWIVEEEVECHDENGSPRIVDIFCYDQEQKVGFIIDPTVRFEKGTCQGMDVDRVKKAKYEPCVKYFKDLYGLDQVEVFGLFVGARGTMTSFFEKFRIRFGLSPTVTDNIAAVAIQGSNSIVHHHFNS